MRKKKTAPLVSVILPMYNAEATIKECMDSIINQTYKNLEIIVIDDGSTDKSVDIVKSYVDARIRIYQYTHDYIRNVNRGFSLCKGEYIARMDADDRMMPTRIAKQVAVFEKYPEVSVCSCTMKVLGKKAPKKFGHDGIISHLEIALLRGNFILHPSIMMRRKVLDLGVKYKKSYIYAEDYKLWVELALKDVVFYNIPEPLVEYRLSVNQVSYIYNEQQAMTAWQIRQELLETLIKRQSLPIQKKIKRLYRTMLEMNQEGLIPPRDFYLLFARIFQCMVEYGEL